MFTFNSYVRGAEGVKVPNFFFHQIVLQMRNAKMLNKLKMKNYVFNKLML